MNLSLKINTPAQNKDEYLKNNESERLEKIDGVVHFKALPGGHHGYVESCILREVNKNFSKAKRLNGTGGWWIITEVSIFYKQISEKGRQLTADIAGWRREKIPAFPKKYPVMETPDWVCEVCHTTRKKDTTIVPETLAAEGVEWYWLADIENENLMVFQLSEQGYVLKKSLFRDDGNTKIPPFEAVELNIGVLFGDDLED
jgi:Uma2 family endonuclease